MSCVDSKWKATRDVADSLGDELQKMMERSTHGSMQELMKHEHLMSITVQFPPSLKDLQEPIQKLFFVNSWLKTTMQLEALIKKARDLAEEKNLLEAFMIDQTRGAPETARINMGQLPGETWKKRLEYQRMLKDLGEYKNGLGLSKIPECVKWAKEKKICVLCGKARRKIAKGPI